MSNGAVVMTEAEAYYKRKNSPARRVAKALLGLGLFCIMLPFAGCGVLVLVAMAQ